MLNLDLLPKNLWDFILFYSLPFQNCYFTEKLDFFFSNSVFHSFVIVSHMWFLSPWLYSKLTGWEVGWNHVFIHFLNLLQNWSSCQVHEKITLVNLTGSWQRCQYCGYLPFLDTGLVLVMVLWLQTSETISNLLKKKWERCWDLLKGYAELPRKLKELWKTQSIKYEDHPGQP